MSSILSSQGVVLATAMVVSSTVLYLAFSKQKALADLISKNHEDSQPNNPKLRSCLYSEEKKREKKKKRVQFAENVKDTKGNGEEYRRQKETAMFAKQREEMNSKRRNINERNCRNEISDQSREMPANRIALYSGILRDRIHRIECSH